MLPTEVESKYLVLKTEDINKYLTDRMKNGIATICAEIKKGRIADGKTPSKEYLLVNSDSIYIDAHWALMKDEINKKESKEFWEKYEKGEFGDENTQEDIKWV